MKKASILLTLILMTACTENNINTKEESINNSGVSTFSQSLSTSNTNSQEEGSVLEGEIKINSEPERIIDLNGSQFWEVFSPTDVIERAHSEKMFMFSDAEALEDEIINYYSSGATDKQWHHYLLIFNFQTVDYYPDYGVYFDKLSEASKAFDREDFEGIVLLMKEAKEIRKSLD